MNVMRCPVVARLRHYTGASGGVHPRRVTPAGIQPAARPLRAFLSCQARGCSHDGRRRSDALSGSLRAGRVKSSVLLSPEWRKGRRIGLKA